MNSKVQARLHIRAISPELVLLAHVNDRPKGNVSQRPRVVVSVSGSSCAMTDWFNRQSEQPVFPRRTRLVSTAEVF